MGFTIVFFISYMNLVGRGRKEMLIAGGAFALAVFVTYLLVGVGTLSFMSYLNPRIDTTPSVSDVQNLLTKRRF